MDNLTMVSTGSVDQVFCINSLQWVTNWRQVIFEIKRILDPRGSKRIYLVVHPHRMGVYIPNAMPQLSEPAFQVQSATIEKLVEELQAAGFSIEGAAMVHGKGLGQMGKDVARVLITAELS